MLYLLLTITPFAIVAPALSPLLDRGSYARRTSMAVASVGSAVLVLLMAGDIKGLLLFPEAFGVLVLSKLYLVAKAALVPSMTETDDDLASANAKLAVLASLAGFVASPVAVGILQLGAAWVLRLAFVVFLLGGVAAVRLPKSVDAHVTGPACPGRDPWPRARASAPAPGPPAPRPRPARAAASATARIDVARERQRLGLPLYVARGRARAGGDVGDQGGGRLLDVLLGVRASSPARGHVVVRLRAPDERHRLAPRLAARAGVAQVPVRAAADPVLA